MKRLAGFGQRFKDNSCLNYQTIALDAIVETPGEKMEKHRRVSLSHLSIVEDVEQKLVGQ